MKRLAVMGLGFFCCVCLMVASERRAFGYVDPGSGLFIIQSIASVAAAVGYYFRRKLGALFGKGAKAEVPVAATAPAKRTTSRLA